VGDDGSVYRYGGEEFAAILPGARPIQALAVAERLRAAVEADAFDLRDLSEGPDELRVTVSVGVSGTESGPIDRLSDAGVIVKEADESVYRAKELGRNRVEAWGAVGATGPELVRAAGDKPVMVLIESDHLAATLIKTLLKRRNDPEIHWFTRGQDAVEFLSACVERGEYPCDLLVTDSQLPDTGGLDVFESFKGLGLKDRVPFYVLSGTDDSAVCDEIKAAGVSACVTKAEFVADMAKWLRVIGSSDRAAA